jgi:hypothetical protein
LISAAHSHSICHLKNTIDVGEHDLRPPSVALLRFDEQFPYRISSKAEMEANCVMSHQPIIQTKTMKKIHWSDPK